MNRNRLRAMRCEILGDQPAEVFGASRDDDGFAFDLVIRHGVRVLL